MNEERVKELEQEKLTSWVDNGKACEGCIFAYGNTPFDDAPDKGCCAIYPYPGAKPDSVYLDGKECKRKRVK